MPLESHLLLHYFQFPTSLGTFILQSRLKMPSANFHVLNYQLERKNFFQTIFPGLFYSTHTNCQSVAHHTTANW